MFELEALFKATESQALMFLLKPIGSGKEATRCEGPALLVIASAKEGLFGQLFIPDVIVDDRDRAFSPDVVVVIDDIIFCISDIDFDLTLVMIMLLS